MSDLRQQGNIFITMMGIFADTADNAVSALIGQMIFMTGFTHDWKGEIGMAQYIERGELLDAIVTSERLPMSAFQIGVAVARKIVKHYPPPTLHQWCMDGGCRLMDIGGLKSSGADISAVCADKSKINVSRTVIVAPESVERGEDNDGTEKA